MSSKKHHYFVIFETITINIKGARRDHKSFFCTPTQLLIELIGEPVISITKLD